MIETIDYYRKRTEIFSLYTRVIQQLPAQLEISLCLCGLECQWRREKIKYQPIGKGFDDKRLQFAFSNCFDS